VNARGLFISKQPFVALAHGAPRSVAKESQTGGCPRPAFEGKFKEQDNRVSPIVLGEGMMDD
jgi:hypothetical protein